MTSAVHRLIRRSVHAWQIFSAHISMTAVPSTCYIVWSYEVHTNHAALGLPRLADHYHIWCHPSCKQQQKHWPDWPSYVTAWSITLPDIASLLALLNSARQLRKQRQQTQRQQWHKQAQQYRLFQ
jgi:hypothetical protein